MLLVDDMVFPRLLRGLRQERLASRGATDEGWRKESNDVATAARSPESLQMGRQDTKLARLPARK